MRTQLLCALALLCGAGVVHAQGWATNGTNGYPQGYPAPQAVVGVGYANAPAAMGYVPNQAGYWGYGAGPAVAYPSYGVQAAGPGYPTFMPAIAPPVMAPPPMMESDTLADEGVAGAAPAKCRWWGSAGYTMNWLRPDRLPAPLVTIGRATDIPPGALGQPGTGVIIGDRIDYDMISGLRLEAGVFLDEGCCFSLDAGAQFFAGTTKHATVASDATGNPIIARPLFDVTTGLPGAEPTSIPNLFTGVTHVDGRAELFGAELNARWHACVCPGLTANVLLGFRYFHLAESLTIRDTLTPLIDGLILFQGMGVTTPAQVADIDQFRTRNNFYGMQVGGQFRCDGEWVFLSGFAKCAIGATDQTVDIKGTTGLITPTGVTTANGGLLALPSNSGHFTRTVLSVLPEGGFTFGVKVTSHVQLTAGYSFLVWSGVVRPGRQIDTAINPTQIPSDGLFGTSTTAPNRPLFNFNNEVVWMHTLTLGLAFQY
jgi:hypothetical protein